MGIFFNESSEGRQRRRLKPMHSGGCLPVCHPGALPLSTVASSARRIKAKTAQEGYTHSKDAWEQTHAAMAGRPFLCFGK